jgi:oligopeptide transport system permease protein
LLSAVAFFAVVSASYAIMRVAPGKPYEGEKALDAEVLAELQRQYDFTYWEYVSGVFVRGDLRTSYSHRELPVRTILAEALPVSLELGAYALVFALFAGLAFGIFTAYFRGRWMETPVLAFALLGIALPSFVLGALLQLAFSLKLHWLPVAGWQGVDSKILPVATFALAYAAYITRIARGSFLDNLSKDFIRTARAKGLGPWRIFTRHLLRNSILPVVNYIAPASASILTGTLVIEKIFNIPGLGRWFVESVFQRDYPVAMGVILVYSLFLLALNFLADVAQSFIDPRISLQ